MIKIKAYQLFDVKEGGPFLELPKCSSKMGLLKTKINKKSPKFHECSPQRFSKTKAVKIQLCLSFKEQRYQCPNCIRVSQQVLEELELSRDTIEINANKNKKVNNTERNKVNTKIKRNKHGHKHKIRDYNDTIYNLTN